MNEPISWLARLRAWADARKPKRLDELVAVEFDELEVRVLALAPSQAGRNQRFLWSDITRVCFQDEGAYASDVLIIEHRAAQEPASVPLESRGGPALLGALVERRYFPDHVWRLAIRETEGSLHCWPPREA